MPNPYTEKGNPYTREEVRERLYETLKKNQPIMGTPLGAKRFSARAKHLFKAALYTFMGLAHFGLSSAGYLAFAALEVRESVKKRP